MVDEGEGLVAIRLGEKLLGRETMGGGFVVVFFFVGGIVSLERRKIYLEKVLLGAGVAVGEGGDVGSSGGDGQLVCVFVGSGKGADGRICAMCLSQTRGLNIIV